jgi:hypothetical protein
MERATLIRYYALLLGVAFMLAGIGGFIGGITQPPPADAPHLTMNMSYGYLLGLFPINVVHNIFHLSLGVLGLLAYRGSIDSLRYIRGIGIVLGILTILGLIPALNTLFGFLPIFGHDIWLHGLEAVVALYLGYFYRQTAH